jgi:tight adherence protein B
MMRRVIAAITLLAAVVLPVAPAFAEQQVVIFVVDTSGSMKGAKITAAKEAVSDLSEVIPAEVGIGLVTFNDSPNLTVAPTTSRDAFADGLAEIRVGGNTALYDAILLARRAVSQSTGTGVIVVVSDGEDTSSIARLRDIRAVDWESTQLSIIGVDLTTFTSFQRDFSRITQRSGGLLLAVDEASRLGEALRLSLEESGIVPTVEPEEMPTLTADPLTYDTEVSHIPLAAAFGISLFSTTMLVGASIRRRRTISARRRAMRGFAIQRGVLREQVLRVPTFLLARNGWLYGALDRAGLAMTPVGYRYRQLWLWAVAAVALFIIGVPLLLVLVVATAIAAWLPRRVLVILKQRRLAAFQGALPDFLTITASALRAGLPITQAIESAARESAGELGRQLTRALQEMALGSSLDVALRGISERTESEDFAWLVTAIDVQRRVGGNLSEILDVAATTVRARLELQQEVKTLAAEGMLSARVLTALPVGLFTFLVVTRRDFVAPLWESGIGIVILVGATILMIAGFKWIQRLSRLEV